MLFNKKMLSVFFDIMRGCDYKFVHFKEILSTHDEADGCCYFNLGSCRHSCPVLSIAVLLMYSNVILNTNEIAKATGDYESSG